MRRVYLKGRNVKAGICEGCDRLQFSIEIMRVTLYQQEHFWRAKELRTLRVEDETKKF